MIDRMGWNGKKKNRMEWKKIEWKIIEWNGI